MKKKIAILGGGVGALTTAFELTNAPDWKDRFESITVYQMGWRLGGKGASGRNAGESDRIEEHGLHIFMGFYDNAFHMMNRAYEECRRFGLTPNSPFAGAREAFAPLNLVLLTENVGGRWEIWPIQWPSNDQVPGEVKEGERRGIKPFLVELILMALDKVLEALPLTGAARAVVLNTAQWLEGSGVAQVLVSGVVKTVEGISNLLRDVLHLPAAARAVASAGHASLRLGGAGREAPAASYHGRLQEVRAKAAALRTREDLDENELRALFETADQLVHTVLRAFRALLADLGPDIRRAIVVADTVMTIVRGIFADELVDGSFEKINDLDLTEWLRKHGSLFEEPNVLTRSFYDAAFAYEGGVPTGASIAAGSAIYGIIRLIFTYRGALMWRMQAGMGDTIFTPLYLALKKRGVRFEFFQKVTNLGLSQDRTRIERIHIEVQAELKPERNGEYCPLVPVKTLQNGVERELLCWPDRPVFDQLVQGEELKHATLANPNLESYWADWRLNPPKTRELKVGEDFDTVVLGISLGALPLVCSELIAQPSTPPGTSNFPALDKWRNMVSNVKLVRTQGLQLWLDRSPEQMGFALPAPFAERPLLCSFVEPFDTWCDMTHLIPRESFNPPPAQLAYFCNAAPNDPSPPPFTEHGYPAAESHKAERAATDFLNESARVIWPQCMDPADPARFDPRQIVSRFFRLNVEPSELYVLSVKGSGASRLWPWESGFENLVLAGDWTRCILDLGCVEAAVISGKLAAGVVLEQAPQILGLIGARLEEVPEIWGAHVGRM